MGSVGIEKEEKAMIITQVSFGGFDKNVRAKEFTNFLEDEIGMIWRCRLKNSWTPPESYPNYEVTDTTKVKKTDDYEKVEPHAFVHFASPEAAIGAKNAAGSCELIYYQSPLMVNLGPESSSKTNLSRQKIYPFKFPDVCVEIGTLVSLNEFWVGWKGPASGVDFVVDPFDGSCKILFTKETAFSFKGKPKHAVLKCDFKLEFLVRDIVEIKQCNNTSSLIILLQLSSAPHIFYRTADDDIYVSVSVRFDLLDDEDPWIRTTDFTSGVIGSSNSYMISMSPRYGAKLNMAIANIKEQRIPYSSPRQLKVLQEPAVPTLPNTFFCIPCKDAISFEIIFMVNAVLHKGIVNQHQLSDKFFELLKTNSREVNIAALRHMYCYRRPVFDACRRLRLIQEWLLKNPKVLKGSKISDYNIEVNRLVITPTRAYCLPPEVELSNRVLRKYKEVADRFLRVTFMDEGFHPLYNHVLNYYVAPIVKDITSNSFPQKTTVFKRVKTMIDGFDMCGRKYSFLAFSSNQLRDQSAWFFAEGKNTSVNNIVSWMGKFKNRNVAKCAARMGQCFSSTYATIRVPRNDVDFDFPDIKRNKYVFSDGIGIITPDLAAEVAEKLPLTENRPSAYQIRYAGCKGVIACWPGKDDGIHLYLRESMNKFESKHDIIEVVSWTRFQPGFLNRQIVTLLSSLDVPNEVFSKRQDKMVYKLDQVLTDTDVALDVIISSCEEEGNTAALMLSAGFKPQTEPHLKGMLTCIRASQLGDLIDKARIFVSSAHCLMGCLDELGLLEQGQCFIQVSNPSLEKCFVKHGFKISEADSNVKVIKGTVVIAKNPCLHPGDVRILEAVDIPALHHLVDCLVFPQKGDRPHSDEASGSDLDGDLYFVTWDEDLIPPRKKSWPPMDYAPAEAKALLHGVTREDIMDFFSKNMVNENLGVICNAHVVHADLSDYGAMDEKCIRLAELAATAVDFPKTGKFVIMPQSLRPKVYPDFMEKDEFKSYESKKILGILYRKIKNASQEDVPSSSTLSHLPEDLKYDADLEVACSEDLIQDAWNHKCTYDGHLNALLGQYKVNTEEEVVSGHIWSMPKNNGRKQRELKERLKHAYHALRKEFRIIFDNVDSDLQEIQGDLKLKMYEQKASAWYRVTYHPEWVKKYSELRRVDEEDTVPAFLSFAWIPVEYLARIKISRIGTKNGDTRRPQNVLSHFLAGHK